MEKLTLVKVAPRWEGDAAAVLGWPDESWDEYATACVEHVDLHPAGPRASSNSERPVALASGFRMALVLAD